MQLMGVPLHVPDAEHMSPVVHAFPSLHEAPVLAAYVQVPPAQVPIGM